MSYDPNAEVDHACVRFSMHFPDGLRHAAISANALVEFYGADMTQAGLLNSYRANFRTIHAVAQQLGAQADRRTLDNGILITRADLAAAGDLARTAPPEPAAWNEQDRPARRGGAARKGLGYLAADGPAMAAETGRTPGSGTAGGRRVSPLRPVPGRPVSRRPGWR